MFYNIIESYIWLAALSATHQAAASAVPLRFFSSWQVARRLSVSIATPRLRMGLFRVDLGSFKILPFTKNDFFKPVHLPLGIFRRLCPFSGT